MLEGNVSRKRIEVLKDAADANEVPGVSIELFKVANMGGDSVTERIWISQIIHISDMDNGYLRYSKGPPI